MGKVWAVKTGRKRIIIAAALVSVLAILFLVWKVAFRERPKEMIIPDEAMFEGAPSVTENQELTITFTYDDSAEPVPGRWGPMQEIEWTLLVYPKEGVEVHDFYCTLMLEDWILERSSSPSLKYMGIEKGVIKSMPTGSNSLLSSMTKYVHYQTVNYSMYETVMTTPLKIMVAYDGQERYYYVTPTRAVDGPSEREVDSPPAC